MRVYEITDQPESHALIINGCRVPFLEAHLGDNGRIYLVLDDRFGLELSDAEAQAVIPFIADCIAVARGYPCHACVGEQPPQSVPS
jgi:hypothetical protein